MATVTVETASLMAIAVQCFRVFTTSGVLCVVFFWSTAIGHRDAPLLDLLTYGELFCPDGRLLCSLGRQQLCLPSQFGTSPTGLASFKSLFCVVNITRNPFVDGDEREMFVVISRLHLELLLRSPIFVSCRFYSTRVMVLPITGTSSASPSFRYAEFFCTCGLFFVLG